MYAIDGRGAGEKPGMKETKVNVNRGAGRRVWSFVVAVLACVLLLPYGATSGVSHAASATTKEVLLYPDRTQMIVNRRVVELDTPAVVLGGRMFVPAKPLGDAMGFRVEWSAADNAVMIDMPSGVVRIGLADRTVRQNDVQLPFDDVAAVAPTGRLLVRLTWLMDGLGASYAYEAEYGRVRVVYVPPIPGVVGRNGNSRPVAKFTTDKRVYRLGEPVRYYDFSYDPDAEGLVSRQWTGRQEAFFRPGRYAVSLQVTDRNGNVSDVFTREIEVTAEPYFRDEFEYRVYMNPIGSVIRTDWKTLYGRRFFDLPPLPKKAEAVAGRALLVSNSPETFELFGVLYRDTVNGKARLYASHVNGTDKTVQFVIVAENRTDREVSVRTTRSGEVYPSVYAHLIGYQATVDFLFNDPVDETLTVPPRGAVVYRRMAEALPGQGFNAIYDVETDGEVTFTFAALDAGPLPKDLASALAALEPLPFEGNIRGTFPVSHLRWEVDASSFAEPSVLTIGDGKTDEFVSGFDPMRGETTRNFGNYGVTYEIVLKKPRKATILFLARGGGFAGPMKIDGRPVMVPESGVLGAFEGLLVLHRTSGNEAEVRIEFSPPAASAFPVDLIFVPTDERG